MVFLRRPCHWACLGWMLGWLWGGHPGRMAAQPAAQNISWATPLLGNKVGVYVSKKNLSVSPLLNPAMAAFLQQNDSLGLQEEELRLALSIQLGNYLAKGLQQDLGAAETYFVNSDPDMARAFITGYANPNLPNYTALLSGLPAGTNYVLVVDSLHLGTVLRRSYYAVSNHIVSERRSVIVARLRLRLLDVLASSFTAEAAVSFDADVHSDPPVYVRHLPGTPESARFLDDVLNLGFEQLFAPFR